MRDRDIKYIRLVAFILLPYIVIMYTLRLNQNIYIFYTTNVIYIFNLYSIYFTYCNRSIMSCNLSLIRYLKLHKNIYNFYLYITYIYLYIIIYTGIIDFE